jgi:energy-coupling factor transport system permease protein
MFRNISLGQYIPVDSFLHQLDPRSKILATLFFILAIFAASFPLELTLLYLIAFMLLFLSRLHIIEFWPTFKPFLIIILITVVIQLLFIPGRNLLQFYFISISYEGLRVAVSFTLRFVLLLFIVRLLTATTSPVAMMDGLEQILKPLHKLGLAVNELVMIMTISLRFIPLFIEEAQRIRNAQLCRGADFQVGNLSHRLQILFAWLLPLLRVSMQRAQDLSQAMEARAYQGGEGRTRLHVLQLGINDYLYVLSMIIVFIVIQV